ncbi:hypothetical protein [Deinococcus aquatilis]|uniref:hypothetical protein n=1 Tax=Deinococcus aquatilis TaxID=519440 RepID=UPI0012F9C937|nr:hypothetical protein [Deinococcus aquatilis]
MIAHIPGTASGLWSDGCLSDDLLVVTSPHPLTTAAWEVLAMLSPPERLTWFVPLTGLAHWQYVPRSDLPPTAHAFAVNITAGAIHLTWPAHTQSFPAVQFWLDGAAAPCTSLMPSRDEAVAWVKRQASLEEPHPGSSPQDSADQVFSDHSSDQVVEPLGQDVLETATTGDRPEIHDLSAGLAPCLTTRILARSRVRVTHTFNLPGAREPVIELPEGVSLELCCLQFAALQRFLNADLIIPGDNVMIEIATETYVDVYLEFFGGQECGDRQYADVTLNLYENWEGRARFLTAAQVLNMNLPGLRVRLLEVADPGEDWPEVEAHRQARMASLKADPEHPSLQDV